LDNQPTSGELLTLPWEDLVRVARQSMQSSDSKELSSLDAAFHHLYFRELAEGDDDSRSEFLAGILRVIESEPAHSFKPPSLIESLLTRWRHLHELIDAARRNVDPVDQASRLVRSRAHAEDLMKIVAREGSRGISVGALSQRLEVTMPHAAKLLRELEALYLIERHRSGRHTFVTLGPVGLVMNRREAWSVEVKPPTDEEVRALFGGAQPLVNAVGCFGG